MSFPEIEALLPHRAPMLWIDRVIARDGARVRCELTVRADHVFVEDARAESLIAIEWMAQAVGALVGLTDRASLFRLRRRWAGRTVADARSRFRRLLS